MVNYGHNRDTSGYLWTPLLDTMDTYGHLWKFMETYKHGNVPCALNGQIKGKYLG